MQSDDFSHLASPFRAFRKLTRGLTFEFVHNGTLFFPITVTNPLKGSMIFDCSLSLAFDCSLNFVHSVNKPTNTKNDVIMIFSIMPSSRGVRHGVSKRVEDGRKLPVQQAATPEMAVRTTGHRRVGHGGP
jgi:hypothetical protein